MAKAVTKKSVKKTPVKSKAQRTPVVKAEVGDVKKLSPRKKLLLLGLVLVLGLLIFSAKDLLIAATVNGYPVSRLSVVRELEKQGGKQVLDNLVNEMIIAQEARKAKIVVGEADIDAKVNEVKSQIEAQGQDLDTILSSRGMSQDDLRKQLKTQIYLEKLLESKISINDEEINAFLETNKEFMPEGLSDDEYKNLAQNELKQQKLSAQYGTWLEEAKANSSVNYFVDY